MQANDLLVAHIARVGNAAINVPSGWTAASGTNNGNFIRQATHYRVASGSEPASYTWTWTGSQPAAGGMSAYYGVKGSSPLDVVGTAATANNTTTVTALSLTTTANDALVLAFFASNSNSTYSTATGMNERHDVATTGMSIGTDDMSQATAGATGSKTSTASASGRVVAHQVAFHVDDVASTVVQSDPGSPLAGTFALDGTATDQDSAVAQVQFQRSPAGAGTWTNVGAADATSPYSVSFGTTTVTDGLYDFRTVATDVAGNAGTSTAAANRRIDNTTPSSAISFPAASTTYGAAGWNAGCGTSGFCGTHSDGTGSGVQSVQVSIRRGAGNYWSGGSFSSGTEVWDAATLAGGSWSYAFAAASFPADGSYTVRVRAVDAAGNIQSPAGRTFTIDTTAPQTTIDSSPADRTSSAGADFTFSASEGGSGFQCRLDGGSWGACASPETYAGLADGSHTFDVRATDTSGTTDPTPASHTWTVDATPPGGGLADPGQYLRGTVALGASPTDTGVGVQSVDFQLSPADAGTWTSIDVDASDPYGLSWDTTGETDGLYDLRVVVTDNAGNVTPSAVVEDRVVDNTAPGATMDDPGAYLRATVALTSTTSDGGSGVASVAYERSAAGAGAWTPVAASWDTTAVADGLYDLRVVVTDNAGNSTTSAPIGGRRVDNTKPSVASSGPADGSTVAAAGSLAVVAGEDVTGIASAEIDGAPAPAPTVAGDTVTFTSAFANGAHTLSGELEDLAGNRQPIRVHFTVWTGASADYPTSRGTLSPGRRSRCERRATRRR